MVDDERSEQRKPPAKMRIRRICGRRVRVGLLAGKCFSPDEALSWHAANRPITLPFRALDVYREAGVDQIRTLFAPSPASKSPLGERATGAGRTLGSH